MKPVAVFLTIIISIIAHSKCSGADWVKVENEAEAKKIRQFVEDALDGKEFSHTDDDTKIIAGDRVGVRHHLNSCTLNTKMRGIEVETREGVLTNEYRIKFPCIMTATYVRIDYGGVGGGKKTEEAIREEFTAEAIVSPSKSEVNVTKRDGGNGSGDGRGRMMAKVPGKMTEWLQAALK